MGGLGNSGNTADLRHSEAIASCPRDLEETPAIAPEIDD
jgi:hypothetical protein